MKALKFVGSSLDDLVAQLSDAVYVLHAFHKKTRKTDRRDIDLARQRYRQIGGKS
jgi:phage-related protein